MKQIKWLAAAVVFTLVGVSATVLVRAQTAKAPSPDARREVLDRLNEIKAAAEGLSAENVFKFVLDNDSGVLAQNGKLYLTKREALETTRQGFTGLKQISYQFDQHEVSMLSPTIALATGEGSTSATTEGGRTVTSRFAQSILLVLTNGEWKVFHAHRSFPPRQ